MHLSDQKFDVEFMEKSEAELKKIQSRYKMPRQVFNPIDEMMKAKSNQRRRALGEGLCGAIIQSRSAPSPYTVERENLLMMISS
jgi:hypothetical protein